MNIQKIKSYIGFAKKSNALVYGVDMIREKRVYVAVYSNSLAEASKQRCESLKEKGTKVYEVDDRVMFDLTQMPNVKALGIKNEELAKAIINNF